MKGELKKTSELYNKNTEIEARLKKKKKKRLGWAEHMWCIQGRMIQVVTKWKPKEKRATKIKMKGHRVREDLELLTETDNWQELMMNGKSWRDLVIAEKHLYLLTK